MVLPHCKGNAVHLPVAAMDEMGVLVNMNKSKNESQSPAGRPRSMGPRAPGLTRIKVVGVGDSGCKGVRWMSDHDVPGVKYVLVNTEFNHPLASNGVTEIVKIEPQTAEGDGWVGDLPVDEVDVGAATKKLHRALGHAELVLLTAGMGGGTGTKTAPSIGRIAEGMGAFVVGIVTTPFSFEGTRRIGEAVAGVARLRPCVDSLIVIHSDRLLHGVSPEAEIGEAFDKADEAVARGMLAICESLNNPWEVSVEFTEVRRVLSYPGGVLMGVGQGRGRLAAAEAVRYAVANPLLNLSISGAKGVLLSVKGGPQLTVGGVNAAGEMMARHVKPKVPVLYGMSIDPSLEDQVEVTLIATGL